MKTGCKLFLPLLLSYALFAVLLFATADQVPERVATHFNGAGGPNGWMTHSGYLWFNAVFGMLFPFFIAGTGFMIRVLPPAFVNIPHRDYWLAPDQRAATCDYFAREMAWLACLAIAFIAGLHLLTLRANRAIPPHLEISGVLLVAGPFLAGLGFFLFRLLRRFRSPPSGF